VQQARWIYTTLGGSPFGEWELVIAVVIAVMLRLVCEVARRTWSEFVAFD
jgi:hypothetical protein